MIYSAVIIKTATHEKIMNIATIKTKYLPNNTSEFA